MNTFLRKLSSWLDSVQDITSYHWSHQMESLQVTQIYPTKSFPNLIIWIDTKQNLFLYYSSNVWHFQFHNTCIIKCNYSCKTSFFLSVLLSQNKIKKKISFFIFKIISNCIYLKLSCSFYSDKYLVLSNYGGDWGTQVRGKVFHKIKKWCVLLV